MKIVELFPLKVYPFIFKKNLQMARTETNLHKVAVFLHTIYILDIDFVKPIALRTAKTPQSFSRSECNRIKKKTATVWSRPRVCLFTAGPRSAVGRVPDS